MQAREEAGAQARLRGDQRLAAVEHRKAHLRVESGGTMSDQVGKEVRPAAVAYQQPNSAAQISAGKAKDNI